MRCVEFLIWRQITTSAFKGQLVCLKCMIILLRSQDSMRNQERYYLNLALKKLSKENTCKLACNQVRKIELLKDELQWSIYRFEATPVFMKKEEEEAKDVWDEAVLHPCIERQ